VRVCVRRYEATAAAVGLARRHAGALARGWGLGEEVAEAVELVVSELVTNSVQATTATTTATATASATASATATVAGAGGGGAAGRGVVAVRLAAAGGSLLVEVWDRHEASPVPANPDLDLDAEGGRGLLLVAACAARWSYFRPRSGGKVVWAEIALPPPDPAPGGGPAVPLPRRIPAQAPGRVSFPVPAVPVAYVGDPALLARVADGLRALDDWTAPLSPAGGGALP
jgi:anti-sigma regulatory factor (Ser/Thr protein kinase)